MRIGNGNLFSIRFAGSEIGFDSLLDGVVPQLSAQNFDPNFSYSPC